MIPAVGGKVLDASAIADLATGRTLYAQTVVRTALAYGGTLVVPMAALVAAWRHIPDRYTQVVDGLLNAPVTVLEPLTRALAPLIGRYMEQIATDDLVTAHVAWCAKRRSWPVVTTDPNQLRRVAPEVDIEQLP